MRRHQTQNDKRDEAPNTSSDLPPGGEKRVTKQPAEETTSTIERKTLPRWLLEAIDEHLSKYEAAKPELVAALKEEIILFYLENQESNRFSTWMNLVFTLVGTALGALLGHFIR